MGEGYLKCLFELNGWVNINRGRAVGLKMGYLSPKYQNPIHVKVLLNSLLVCFNYLKVVSATFVLV